MASPAYERLLDVQAIDLNLAQLRHRHQSHPLRTTLAEAEAAVSEAATVMTGIEEHKHQLDRDLKRLSDEVELIEAKRTEIDGKLYDGSVTGSKELLALQSEAAGLLERQRGIEDSELELMEQLEAVDAELAAARNTATSAADAQASAVSELQMATAEIETEIAGIETKRLDAAEAAPADLLARYGELSAQYDGHVVARLNDGTCDGCHIKLSAVAVDQLTKAPEDAVVTCEECGRMLVR